jgi:hypothetical protein
MQAQDAAEMAHADDLLTQVRALQTRTETILSRAERKGELRTALAAIREARSNLELLGRLAGELQDGTTVNVLVSPQWITVRAALVEVLAPYPEARAAVTRRLSQLETG